MDPQRRRKRKRSSSSSSEPPPKRAKQPLPSWVPPLAVHALWDPSTTTFAGVAMAALSLRRPNRPLAALPIEMFDKIMAHVFCRPLGRPVLPEERESRPFWLPQTCDVQALRAVAQIRALCRGPLTALTSEHPRIGLLKSDKKKAWCPREACRLVPLDALPHEEGEGTVLQRVLKDPPAYVALRKLLDQVESAAFERKGGLRMREGMDQIFFSGFMDAISVGELRLPNEILTTSKTDMRIQAAKNKIRPLPSDFDVTHSIIVSAVEMAPALAENRTTLISVPYLTFFDSNRVDVLTACNAAIVGAQRLSRAVGVVDVLLVPKQKRDRIPWPTRLRPMPPIIFGIQSSHAPYVAYRFALNKANDKASQKWIERESAFSIAGVHALTSVLEPSKGGNCVKLQVREAEVKPHTVVILSSEPLTEDVVGKSSRTSLRKWMRAAYGRAWDGHEVWVGPKALTSA